MRFKITVVLLPFLYAASLFGQPVFDENYERLLLPVLVGSTPGPFGSRFDTSLVLGNKSLTETLEIWGLEAHCGVPVICSLPDPAVPVRVKPYGEERLDYPGDPGRYIVPNGNPGRFVYVPRAQANLFAMTLRAYDVSRAATSYGTQMPVIRERDFTDQRIVLPDVPMNTPFRNTLRIYSKEPATVFVWFAGPEFIGSPTIVPPAGQEVFLRAGMNEFDPAYAQFTTFEPYPANLAVVVEPVVPPCLACNPPFPTPKLWAFITVTNNDTQHITTIFPQP